MATGHWLNKVRLAPLFALMFGVGAATLVAAMLPGTFAAFVEATGLAKLTGLNRLLAMLAAFVVVALPVWIATSVVERALEGAGSERKPSSPASDDDDLLDLEPFAESEPAPARRPIFADRELGAPLMSDEALRTIVPLSPPEVDPPLAPPVDDIAIAPLSPPEDADNDGPVAPALPLAQARTAGEDLAEPLVAPEFDLETPDDADDARPGESSIDGLIRRLESGLARRGAPTPDGASPQFAAVLRSEIARAAPVASARTGKPDDATARALHILRQMPNG